MSIATAASKQGVKRFIFLSSIKAVGDSFTAEGVISLSSPCSPNCVYGISKLRAEKRLLQLSNETDLEVVIIRPPLIYGPGAKGNLAAIVRAAKNKIPLPLKGINNNRRSVVSLANLASLIHMCCFSSAAPAEIFFVKDREDQSTVEIIREACKSEGVNPILFWVPVPLLKFAFYVLRKPAVSNRLLGDLCFDDSKTRQKLGWQPLH